MHDLAVRISEWIGATDTDTQDAAFETLALALFACQYERNEPYRNLCTREGRLPGTITRWQDIPAVPASAFKQFRLCCAPDDEIVAVFHSSGTTGVQTSRHYFDRDGLSLYEASLRRGFADALGNREGLPLWALMPPPASAPHSSLTHMLYALDAARFFWDDPMALSRALHRLTEPILLFGTAFAFVALFDGSEENWRLPDGSRIVETGGFKGRTREVPRDELYGLFESRLGVPISSCFSEYGMSEMASQFYGRGLDATKRGPHWVRTRCLDPVTGEDALTGEPGVLCHYDLANFNSVLALQTQDLGIQTEDGFVLLGRAPDAPIRGCSLTVEELWTQK